MKKKIKKELKKIFMCLIISTILLTNCDSDVIEQKDESEEQLVELIQQVPEGGLIVLSNKYDESEYVYSLKSGYLDNRVSYALYDKENATAFSFAIGLFSDSKFKWDDDPDCEVSEDAGRIRQIKFAKCVMELLEDDCSEVTLHIENKKVHAHCVE